MLHTVTVSTQQGRFTVYTADTEIGKTIFCRRDFELEEMRRVIEYLRLAGYPLADRTVLDIGANMGVIGIGFIKMGWLARAVLVEPDPQNFELLLHNVGQNGLNSFVVSVPCAVSDEGRKMVFELNENNFGDHRIRAPVAAVSPLMGEDGRRVIEVETRSIDQIVDGLPAEYRDTICLIWIDVQGFEGRVLLGGRRLWAKKAPVVAEICPYMILRSGLSREAFLDTVQQTFTEYLVWRRGRYISYPVAMFGQFWDELGETGDFENVIFRSDLTA